MRFARLLRAFRVRVYVFEHTRIRVRSFPPLFEHEWTPSLQERIDTENPVVLSGAKYVVYETIHVPAGHGLRGEATVSRVVAPSRTRDSDARP